MTDREKVNAIFDCILNRTEKSCSDADCSIDDECYGGCSKYVVMPYEACKHALALLKEQEPRVMTLKELLDVGRVWESSAPPYLWLDKNRSIYNTISFWCAWRDIYEMIHGRHDKYTDENYGSEWRCWTARPTEEQMRDTPWEGE